VFHRPTSDGALPGSERPKPRKPIMNSADILRDYPSSVRNALPAPTLNDPDTPLWASLYPVQKTPLQKLLWTCVPAWFARPSSGVWPAHEPARRTIRGWVLGVAGAALVAAGTQLALGSETLRVVSLFLEGQHAPAVSHASARPEPAPAEVRRGVTHIEEPAPQLASALQAAAVTTPSPAPTTEPAVQPAQQRLGASGTEPKSKGNRKKRSSTVRHTPRHGGHGPKSPSVTVAVDPLH
jgi:hypothetical protein